jgi:4,5-DOPA dioxygenase extradiol
MLPTLFISHGAPTLALSETPARKFLEKLGTRLPRPRAIVVASAHWETSTPRVSAMAQNTTIHDFRGFPRALYDMRYPAPGDPELATRIVTLLTDAGYPAVADPSRGLDHGAWVPLVLMYPTATIPTVQLSIQPHRGPAHHLAIGRALAPLRAEDVLIVGSGSFTHDLGRFHGQGVDAPETPDVIAFAAWFDDALVRDRRDDLIAYRDKAPHAADQHPTEEHLLPLFVALGAAGEEAQPKRLHASAEYGMLRMDAYAFGGAQALS